jgi:gamma-glutamyltranspeptidase/glutathione hydrolase
VLQPVPVRFAPTAAVAAADHLAAEAGAHLLRQGGSAADAAVAASAVMAVTSPHLCGMGGDLFALVHDGSGGVHALVAAGRAGSGADPARLRAEGHVRMPATGDVRVTPLPGCVDGWLALLRRFGRLPVAEVLAPAAALADGGFPASPTLAAAAPAVAGREWAADLAGVQPGTRVRRPGVARALRAVGAGGRSGFYLGEFGTGLLRLARGEFTPADLEQDQAEWAEPLALDVWGARLWTAPPPSSGYLALGAATVAAHIGIPDGLDDPDDPAWAHLLIEASRAVGHDRPDALHEHADGRALLDPARLAVRGALFDPARACDLPLPTGGGDTTYLCAVDGSRSGVSLIQSNAGGFGSGLGEPSTGIGLQNRGLGFSLEPGHPAEYGPGRRPPSTLLPVVATRPDGSLWATLGTMGGDAQPQVVLQLLARLLGAGQAPAEALAAGRFALGPRVPGEAAGFATWQEGGRVAVEVEGHAPAAWVEGLAARGHVVRRAPPFDSRFGHAQAILVRPDGMLDAAADPRPGAAGAVGW